MKPGGIFHTGGLATLRPNEVAAVLSPDKTSHGVPMITPQHITELTAEIHADNVLAGWWPADKTTRNVGELLMLVTSELAEAGEELGLINEFRGFDPIMDDKLPHRLMLEVELADTAIRVFDIAGGLNLDLTGPYRIIWANDTDIVTAAPGELGTNLFRLVQEVAGAMEGHRKGMRHKAWPEYLEIEVRLARLILGIWQLADVHGLDVAEAMVEKRAFNKVREDHKLEARNAPGGKTY